MRANWRTCHRGCAAAEAAYRQRGRGACALHETRCYYVLLRHRCRYASPTGQATCKRCMEVVERLNNGPHLEKIHYFMSKADAVDKVRAPG